MKTNLNKIFFAIIAIIGLVSCSDRELVTVDNVGAPIVMDLSSENLFLDQNFPGNPALTISWSAGQYSVPVAISYTVEIASDQAFTTPYPLTVVTESKTTASFTVNQLNEAAKRIGLVPDVSQQMYFRVTSYLGTNDLSSVSNVTGLNITPYLASPTYDFTDVFLIGDATAGGWDNLLTNGNLLPLLKTSAASKYTFTGYFKVGGFKMIKVKGSWDAQFGLGASTGQLSTDGGSGNIPITTAGYYKFTVDTAGLSYTLEPIADPSTNYSNVSIIGTVNGNFDVDTQLTKSTFDPHLWTGKSVTLKSGEFKFRANNAWDVNWGGDSEFFGTATMGGGNIPLAAEWIYDVYFNDVSGSYTLIPVK